MPFSLSPRSLNALRGVHPDLVRVVKRAITMTGVDFLVTCGVRTPAEQAALYAQGRTKPGPKVTWTLNSNHFVSRDGFGHAVDVAAWVNGTPSWIGSHYSWIAKAMKDAAKLEKVALVWGGDWKQADLVHFELDRAVYA